jgi:tripartite-type tricarboxylate transporter receptor subunit TctC
MQRTLAAFALSLLGTMAFGQNVTCPEKNVNYWQAFPPGGESDLSARHQQVVLHKKCPAVDTIIQYKAGAGGALMWSQMNQLPADGLNVVGVNLPHIVFQPIQGDVQYKTADVTPVYWFHFTPDILVVPAQSPIRNFQDFVKAAKANPGKLSLGGSGQYSANHAAHERLDAAFGSPQASFRPLARAEHGCRDEGPGGQERLRAGERGRRGDGLLHGRQDQAVHRRRGAHGTRQEVVASVRRPRRGRGPTIGA